jgi:hypothetical protein
MRAAGIRGGWESSPCLCATVQNFSKYVCVLLSIRTGDVSKMVLNRKTVETQQILSIPMPMRILEKKI